MQWKISTLPNGCVYGCVLEVGVVGGVTVATLLFQSLIRSAALSSMSACGRSSLWLSSAPSTQHSSSSFTARAPSLLATPPQAAGKVQFSEPEPPLPRPAAVQESGLTASSMHRPAQESSAGGLPVEQSDSVVWRRRSNSFQFPSLTAAASFPVFVS